MAKLINCIADAVLVIVVLVHLYLLAVFNASAGSWLEVLLCSALLVMSLLLCAFFFVPMYRYIEVDDVTTWSSSTPTTDPVADIESGNSAVFLKDTEKLEVEEKHKLVFMSEGKVKILNRNMEALLVIGVLMLLYCLVKIAMVARSWSELLLGSFGVVVFSLIFAFFLMPVYRRVHLDDIARLATPSSSMPTTSDLTTNLLRPASEN